MEDSVLLGRVISEQRFVKDSVLLGRDLSKQHFVEGRVLLGRIISEQRFAISIIGPLILYIHSYVVMQMDNGPIRAIVIQSHSVT